MKAITTLYKGPTTKRGSCIVAKTEGNKAIRVPYDNALSAEGNHAKAVQELCKSIGKGLGWEGIWINATLPDGKTEVWVQDNRFSEQVTVS